MINPELTQLPDSFKGSNPDSWTYYSIVTRLPEIAKRIIIENDFSEEINNNIQTLINEISDGKIRLLNDDEMSGISWNFFVIPYTGKTWLEIPWFFAELYFYRRILEAIGYFDYKTPYYKHDPYIYQKGLGIEDGINKLGRLLQSQIEGHDLKSALEKMLKLNLWGNKADLSIWPSGSEMEMSSTLEALINFDDYLLINHVEGIKKYLIGKTPKQIDFLIDNTGFELICDLLFVDFLLRNNFSERIILHLKEYPIFVSDALIKDVFILLDRLNSSRDERIRDFGKRLSGNLKNGNLKFEDEAFWISPLPFWQMPAELKEKIKKSDLIISKGDANYRRLNGDLHWQPDQEFKNIYSEMKVPVLILRVIKSDPIIGISRSGYEKLNHQDSEWMKNGRWGLIQFITWE